MADDFDLAQIYDASKAITEGAIREWERELLEPSAAPSPVEKAAAKRAAADPAYEREVRRAVEAAKAALKAPRPADAPRPDFVRAAPPKVLHTLTFPVYDRKGGGYRIIERAFGINEIKVLIKTLLDSFIGTDEQNDSARSIDAAAHIFSTAPHAPSLEQLARPFKCSRGVIHDTRCFVGIVPGTILKGDRITMIKDFISGIAGCYQQQDRYSRDYDDEGFRVGRFQQYSGARHFIDSHYPFMAFNGSQWYATLPADFMRLLIFHDPSAGYGARVDTMTRVTDFPGYEDREDRDWTLSI